MDKADLLIVAVIFAVLGGAVAAGYPAWGTVTGIVFLLVAAAIGTGAIAHRSERRPSTRALANQKIPNRLAMLSAAAVLTIYGAGYYRTRPAADEFESQRARRKAANPIAPAATKPRTPVPEVATIPKVSRSPRPTGKRHAQTLPATNPRPPITTPSEPAPIQPVVEPAPVQVDAASSSSKPKIAASPTPTARKVQYKNGTFAGWGTCRHGDIEASVVIQDGKIISADITRCLTRYSCSWIADLPAQVISRQNANVDYVSGATQSSDAFSDAVMAALSKASE